MDYLVVKNDYWDPTTFTTLNGDEHFAQKILDDFTSKLFFEDRINLYEPHEGIRKTEERCPQLPGVKETREYLEERYPELIQN